MLFEGAKRLLVAADQILGNACRVVRPQKGHVRQSHGDKLAMLFDLCRTSGREDQVADAGSHGEHRFDDVGRRDGRADEGFGGICHTRAVSGSLTTATVGLLCPARGKPTDWWIRSDRLIGRQSL